MTAQSRRTKSASQPITRLAPTPNCATLIKRLADEDESAFAEFRQATSGLLFALLLRLLSHSEQAAAALEQVYAEIRRRAAKFDSERDTPLIWLLAIVQEQAFEFVRQADDELREIRENDDLLFAAFEPQQITPATAAALTPAHCEVIELIYFSGAKESDIAERLGQRVEIVRSNLATASQKLSELFSLPCLQAKERRVNFTNQPQ